MASLPTGKLQEALKARAMERIGDGNTTVTLPQLPSTVQTERKKVHSILEQIGFADEAEPVVKVL